MANELLAEKVEPPVSPTASVIWMHGLGADRHDFVPITEWYQPLLEQGVRFIFPQAPILSITINQGLRMSAWFDIYDLSFTAREDKTGIAHSSQQIQALIAHEQAQGIDSKRIILAGFSQGGAMALQVGLRFPETLGGIIALSAYLPLVQDLKKERTVENQKTPCFISHGLFDPVVPLAIGEASKKTLVDLDYSIEWKTFPIQHTVVPEQIQAIGHFLDRVLA